ncbi:hypothetical protein EDB81DRAFT_779104 [Dactylonectria macrodidyma]|uniref:Uncharacterized protein n=1 Tax=Dactylonectria macrodidyma TaxID=307937 RepID=A0A9P9JEV1_9HYPO|nr:hypothetical protein EDB81DRAFT_779104 [Dactylonectria macrodidyma]
MSASITVTIIIAAFTSFTLLFKLLEFSGSKRSSSVMSGINVGNERVARIRIMRYRHRNTTSDTSQRAKTHLWLVVSVPKPPQS